MRPVLRCVSLGRPSLASSICHRLARERRGCGNQPTSAERGPVREDGEAEKRREAQPADVQIESFRLAREQPRGPDVAEDFQGRRHRSARNRTEANLRLHAPRHELPIRADGVEVYEPPRPPSARPEDRLGNCCRIVEVKERPAAAHFVGRNGAAPPHDHPMLDAIYVWRPAHGLEAISPSAVRPSRPRDAVHESRGGAQGNRSHRSPPNEVSTTDILHSFPRPGKGGWTLEACYGVAHDETESQAPWCGNATGAAPL